VFSAFWANWGWVFATVEWAFFLLDLRSTLIVFICLQQYFHVWGVFPLPGLWGELINCIYGVLPLAGGDVTLVPSLVTLRIFPFVLPLQNIILCVFPGRFTRARQRSP
jgi:hypothetical protein